MNIENITDYCLMKKGVKEDFPFDEVTMTMKVMGKIFAFIPLDVSQLTISLKCDPDRALDLREQYEEIEGAFHLNKKHWNSVNCEGSLSDKLIKELIDHSYELVVKGLKKSEREALEALQ
ncbi:MAG: MmcQ/YjbR family DNA-binding protein [Saprospiraceae bacterium]